MTDITPKKEIDISVELANLQLYKNHPNGILNVSLSRLSDMLDGRVEIVDPSNPFTYLLETSCMNTAFAVQEMALLSRKLYPRLANNEEDIYLHMSDVDYLGRFSSPAKADVRFNILFNSFKTNAYKDPLTGDYLHTLPKNYKVTVDDFVFTLTAPILIRLTDNDIVDVRYLGDENDTIFNLETNFINFDMFSVNQDETYITFEATLHEVDLEAIELPVEKSKLFKGTVNYTQGRYFYYFKAYHMTDTGWEELLTTHTDQVYDINTPTCIVKVNQTENKVSYYIPPVYVNSGRLGSKVKFVAYTTRGPININFADYRIEDFKLEYNPVFPETDLNETTNSLQLIPKIAFIEGRIIDGKGPKSFAKLKSDVIDNNLGRNHRPVTNVQIENYLDGTNFKLVRNVDTLTNRIFLIEAKLPDSPSRYGVTKLNLGMIELNTTIENLREGKNSVVNINDDVTILPEGTLFEVDYDSLKLLTESEATALRSLVGNNLIKAVNSKRYLSLYYHYVLDTYSGTTALRAYDISRPSIKRTNFKGFNSTSRIGINTINTNVIKNETGFQLDVLANIKKYDEQYDETNLTPYLVHRDGAGSVFFLEGRLFTLIGENPVYRFQIESQYYIDRNHKLHITNFKDNNGSYIIADVDLDSELEIIYLTNRVPTMFESTPMDDYIRGSYLAVGSAVVTLESVNFIFGQHLEYLYTRVHTSTGIEDYLTWDEDVVAVYEKTVYGPDNTVLHNRNEPVLDQTGATTFKHRKGEVKVDVNGVPITGSIKPHNKYMNLLFMDYRSIVANDAPLIEYRDYLKLHLTTMITKNAKDIQKPLLENTVAYLTVPANLNNVLVSYNGTNAYIPAAQSFAITAYVDRRTYEETEIRRGVEFSLLNVLQNYLNGNSRLSKSVVISLMLESVGDFVKSISIDKFTEVNAEYIELKGEGTSISFNKVLSVEPDGYRLSEDVKFNFVLVN